MGEGVIIERGEISPSGNIILSVSVGDGERDIQGSFNVSTGVPMSSRKEQPSEQVYIEAEEILRRCFRRLREYLSDRDDGGP